MTNTHNGEVKSRIHRSRAPTPGPGAIFDVVRGLLSTVQRPVAWAREYIARETAG
jgi:hypothetical protein